MKFIALVFAALLASVSAGPAKAEDRFVDSVVAGLLENLSEQLQELGLDPFVFTDDVDLRLAVTDIFSVQAHVEDFVMSGISNIVLNSIDYNVATSTLNFDESIAKMTSVPKRQGHGRSIFVHPELNQCSHVFIHSSNADVSIFGYNVQGGVSGNVDIQGSRVSVLARINIGIITGTSILDLDVNYSLDDIVSDVQLNIQGEDYSDQVNEILGEIIPDTLHEYQDDINLVLEYYIVYFFNNRD
ncbi:hypothetical protein ACJJTC_018292 [Scirpophaga incertulas]